MYESTRKSIDMIRDQPFMMQPKHVVKLDHLIAALTRTWFIFLPPLGLILVWTHPAILVSKCWYGHD